MRMGVPAVAGQIDAAAERELVVDDDDLLMVTAGDGVPIVKSKPYVPRHPPSQPPSRQRIALERVERSVVPRQNVAAKLGAATRDEGEQLRELAWRASGAATRLEIDRRRDIPAQHEHRVLRRQQRLLHEHEVVCRVLHAVKSVRTLDSPAVRARSDDQRRGGVSADRRRAHADHTAGLARRSARFITHASVSGTETNTAAVSRVAGVGRSSAFVR
jgi:hypothetical protein